jgi:glycosyltransferase involved in cell wall biosynthesis
VKIAMVSAHSSPLDRAAHPHGTQVAGLAAALCRHGHDVTVYSRWDSDAPGRLRTDQGYKVVHVPAGPRTRLDEAHALPHMGDFTSFVMHEWAVSQPDVVHGHRWMSGLVSVLGGRRIRVPVVQTFDSLAPAGDTGQAERGRIEVLIAKEAAHVAVAGPTEAFALSRAGVGRTKISVVPSGVDVDAFTPEGARARRDRRHRVVAAGPLPPNEIIEGILAALSRVDGAELVIADAVPARVRARAEQLGVAVTAGAVVPALLRSADAVVCAPAHEPSGAAALEAMACGVPVVATAAGGLQDVVVHGVTGLLVPPDDAEGLARALYTLLLDDTLRQEFAVASRDRVTARYAWSQVALEVLRVYGRAGLAAAKTPVMSTDPVQ